MSASVSEAPAQSVTQNIAMLDLFFADKISPDRALPSYLDEHARLGVQIPLNLFDQLRAFQSKHRLFLKNIPGEAQLTIIKDWYNDHCHFVDLRNHHLSATDSICHYIARTFASFSISKNPNLKDWDYKEFKVLLQTLVTSLASEIALPQLVQMNLTPLNYRSQGCMIIPKNDNASAHLNGTIDDFIEDVIKGEFGEDLQQEFTKHKVEIYQFFATYESLKEDFPIESSSLPPKIKRFLSKSFSLGIHPFHLPLKMKSFFYTLKKLINDDEKTPFFIAAYVHMRIVVLHPFKEGNGRLARLMMNIILQQYGLPPIYFYSEQEYLSEVRLALQSSNIGEYTRSFAKFISRKVYYFERLKKVAEDRFGTPLERNNFIRDSGFFTCSLKLAPMAQEIVDKAAADS